jgi:RND superfamily putative drug exporter
MTSFGIGGMAVVGVAVLAALTLLPALLGIFGQRVNALRVPLVSRLTTKLQRAPGSGFWHGLALAVMRRPVMIALGVSVLLLGMGWPVFSMKVGLYDASELPPGSEARQGLHLLTTQFPAVNPSPVYVLVQTSDHSPILTQDTLSKVASLTDWLATQPHVTSLVSVTQVPGVPQSALFALYTSGAYQDNPDLAHLVANTTAGDTTLISLKSDAMLDSDAGKALIDHLRTDGKVQAHALRLSVGGFQATSLDFTRALYGQFPQAILFIVLATYLLLLLLFRSLLLPLKAILMNVLSVSAAYGVLVVVFQWGNLEGVLGFTSNGILSNLIPVLLFCVLFGLSMDYEVFLLSRIREEWLRTRDNRAAVAWGLEKTGGVITSAALLFVIIAGAFIFTSFIVTKQVGLGIAVAILVDATIIRLLLVPATMRLLGRWNWWLPGRFGRVSSPEHRE